jgi:hypothetical protein
MTTSIALIGNMPAMMRLSKKAKDIAYAILGKPANIVHKRSTLMHSVEGKLVRQENSRLR